MKYNNQIKAQKNLKLKNLFKIPKSLLKWAKFKGYFKFKFKLKFKFSAKYLLSPSASNYRLAFPKIMRI